MASYGRDWPKIIGIGIAIVGVTIWFFAKFVWRPQSDPQPPNREEMERIKTGGAPLPEVLTVEQMAELKAAGLFFESPTNEDLAEAMAEQNNARKPNSATEDRAKYEGFKGLYSEDYKKARSELTIGRQIFVLNQKRDCVAGPLGEAAQKGFLKAMDSPTAQENILRMEKLPGVVIYLGRKKLDSGQIIPIAFTLDRKSCESLRDGMGNHEREKKIRNDG